MDKYAGYIAASYIVTFGSIFLAALVIALRYRACNRTIEALGRSGIRRRSQAAGKKGNE